MRIVRYMAPRGAGPAVGIVADGGEEIAEAPAAGGDLGALLLLDRAGLERVAATAVVRHRLADVRLLTPVGRPGKILALAANYHPTDKRRDINLDLDTPRVFIKPSTALRGPEEVIPFHDAAEQMVEEIELGVVIGRPGKDIPVERTAEHIFGYTVMNDVSARKLRLPPERATMARYEWFDWLNGKWLDGFCPVGPWIVDRAALPDTTNLEIRTVVSGEERIRSNTERMIFDIPRTIAFISRYCMLEPGDLIATGVALGPAGADEVMLRDGDVVEGTVEGIGTLRNAVRRAS
jgi:2-keto-4-pentenoate hydratase/2-oxohepta-3-ene-1,7-dioic acid hydratase in catechol pathway